MSHNKTTDFACHCAAEVLRVPHEEVHATAEAAESFAPSLPSNSIGLDPTVLIAIIDAIVQAIVTVINNCPQSRREMKASILRPNLFQRAVARRTISNVCANCCGKPEVAQYRGAIADCMVECAMAEKEETVSAILDEVLEVPYVPL